MLILIFTFSVLLVAIVVLLWCLRGFTRTLKQRGFVGVLVRAQDIRSGSAKQKEATQIQVKVKDSDVAKFSASPSHKGILRSGQKLAVQDTRLQTWASTTPKSGRRPHAVEHAA